MAPGPCAGPSTVGRRPTASDPQAEQAFRDAVRRHGWDPDERFTGRYVEWEWERSRHAFDGMFTSLLAKQVLEFGCHLGGTAIVLAALGAEVTAIDVDERFVELSRLNAERYGVARRVRARHIQDTTRLPFADGAFAAVCCNSVLEYVPRGLLGDVQRELDRVLAPGGHIFIMGTSNRLWPYEPHTRRWFTNYIPRWLSRYFAPGVLRDSVWPWNVRRGFGASYVDLTHRDGAIVTLKMRMGVDTRRLSLLAAANRLLVPFGCHVGFVSPTITMVLQKPPAPGG